MKLEKLMAKYNLDCDEKNLDYVHEFLNQLSIVKGASFSTIGDWEVSTTFDSGYKFLGRYYGYIDKIALHLADKVGYGGLRFEPKFSFGSSSSPNIDYKVKRKSVTINLDFFKLYRTKEEFKNLILDVFASSDSTISFESNENFVITSEMDEDDILMDYTKDVLLSTFGNGAKLDILKKYINKI